MASTTQEFLDLVNAALTKRLNGDAYEEYTEAEVRFRGMPVSELFALRDRLTRQLAAENGNNFRLAEPFS